MSTLTGLIGGGGSAPIVSSIPAGSATLWATSGIICPSAQVDVGTALTDVVNISSVSGYLNSVGFKCTTTSGTENVRVQIIIDGTTVYDATKNTFTNSYINVYPSAVPNPDNHSPGNGIALRFESSLRVRGLRANASGMVATLCANYFLT